MFEDITQEEAWEVIYDKAVAAESAILADLRTKALDIVSEIQDLAAHAQDSAKELNFR